MTSGTPHFSPLSIPVLSSTSDPISLVRILRFPIISINSLSKSLSGLSFHKPISRINASIQFKDSVSESDYDDDEDDESLLLDKFVLLEPKLQLKLEHKLRMKLSKKVRLRRKKLDHKRRFRKKGRWPPSKVNRLKNV